MEINLVCPEHDPTPRSFQSLPTTSIWFEGVVVSKVDGHVRVHFRGTGSQEDVWVKVGGDDILLDGGAADKSEMQPDVEKEPTPHRSQEIEALARAKRPAVQLVQTRLSEEAAMVPGSQSVQAVALEALKRPAEHERQLSWPACELYLPAPQSVQVADPVLFW